MADSASSAPAPAAAAAAARGRPRVSIDLAVVEQMLNRSWTMKEVADHVGVRHNMGSLRPMRSICSYRLQRAFHRRPFPKAAPQLSVCAPRRATQAELRALMVDSVSMPDEQCWTAAELQVLLSTNPVAGQRRRGPAIHDPLATDAWRLLRDTVLRAGLRLRQHCSGFSVSFAVNLHSMLPHMFLHENQCAD